MIFAISSHSETAGLDGGETETDSLAEGGGIDMGDLILFADTTVGKVETLPGHVPIRIGGIISAKPIGRGRDQDGY